MDGARAVVADDIDPVGRWAVRAARLVDGMGGPIRPHPLIVIEDGVIAAVEDAQRTGDPGCPVMDLGDVTLLPGLIDAHTHLAWVPLERIEDGLRTAPLRAADAALRTLVGGVTLARDLGGPGRVTLRLRDAIAAGITSGPRLLVAGPMLTTPDGHCHWLGRTASTADEVRTAVIELAGMGIDVLKLMLTGGMATPTTDPAAVQFSPTVARIAVEEAHRAGLPVAAHVLGSAGVRVAIEAGIDTLEHGWTITGREQHYDPAVIERLRGTGIVASVSAHHDLRALLPDGVEELRRRLIPHRSAAAAGVAVVAHSDAGVGPTRFEGFGESVAVFAAGMLVTPAAAVAAVTSVAARALGVDDRYGSVRPGRVADLVTITGDPDEDPRAFEHVRDVRMAGRLVARDGHIVARPSAAGTGSMATP